MDGKEAREMAQGTVSRNRVVVEFQDQYGDTRIVHRKKGSRLSVKRQGDTPVHALNRAAASLLGERIRAFRLAQGLSLADLCIKAGLATASPKQRMRELECGERNEGMRIGTLYAIALALGVSVSDLMPSPEDVAAFANVAPATVTALQVAAA